MLQILYKGYNGYFGTYSENHIFILVRFKTFLTINTIKLLIIMCKVKKKFNLFTYFLVFV